jgi:hypothetical protein
MEYKKNYNDLENIIKNIPLPKSIKLLETNKAYFFLNYVDQIFIPKENMTFLYKLDQKSLYFNLYLYYKTK